jgi:hypothetical protein
MSDHVYKVGVKAYADCQEPECTLRCVTWAHHINLVLTTPVSCIALDAASVQALINQLQGWLDKQ